MMMTDAELTILSLLSEGARHGYELQQLIDERGLREWLTIGFSSIYYLLNRLERQKLLSSELRPEGRGPAQKLFSITEAGRGVLQTAVSDLLRQPRALGSGFELGLANMMVLQPRQVYQTLHHHHHDLQQRLNAITKAYERNQSEPGTAPHIAALYTHSLALMQAELGWLTTFLENWKELYPGVENAPAEEPEAHSAVTRINPRSAQSEPAKMIQRLKRIPPTTGE
jgi:DNA-binding PadR family transcriptional regulator